MIEIKKGFEIICTNNKWLETLLPGFKFEKTPIKGRIYIIDGFQHPRFVYLKGFDQKHKGQKIGWDLLGFEPMPYVGNANIKLISSWYMDMVEERSTGYYGERKPFLNWLKKEKHTVCELLKTGLLPLTQN